MLRPSLPVLAATHLAVVALGYCLVTVTVHFRKEPEAPELRMRVARDRGKTERAGRHHVDSSDAERIRRGDALLTKVEEIAGQRGGTPEDVDERLRKLIELADKSPSSTDPAGEVKRWLMEAGNTPGDEEMLKYEVEVLRWLRANTREALANASEMDPFSPRFHLFRDAPINALVMELGWRAMLQYLSPSSVEISGLRVALLADMRREVGGKSFSGPRAEKVMEDFLRMTSDSGSASVIMLLDLGPDAVSWLDRKVTSGEIPEGIREELEQDTGYQNSLWRVSDLPLERRHLGARLSSTWEMRGKELDMAGKDIRAALENDRDWKYAFRQGAVTAGEVLEAMRAASPELEAKYPAEFRGMVIGELARVDLVATMALLPDLSEHGKWSAMLEKNRGFHGGWNPESFLRQMESMPDDVADALWDERSKAWYERKANYTSWPDITITEWLASHPPGSERDMAVYHLLGDLQRRKDIQPPGFVELWKSIRDPHVLGKLEAEGRADGE